MITRLKNYWRGSVVFKLGVATSAIVFFVAILQSTVGLQIYRLSNVQASINSTSVPLLQQTQRFAVLTTRVLNQTSLLENDLTTAELAQLRGEYLETKSNLTAVLSSISATFLDQKTLTDFLTNRDVFTQVNEELFANQFDQRAQEQEIHKTKTALLRGARDLNDLLDRLLLRSTKGLLTPLEDAADGAQSNQIMQGAYKLYAGDIEALNTLRTSVLELHGLIEHAVPSQSIDELTNDTHFRVRNIALSLTLLQDSEERRQLARFVSDMHRLVSGDAGLLVQLRLNAATRARFAGLKDAQAKAVDVINSHTDKIVVGANDEFRQSISDATSITGIIMWIGVATTLLVMAGIFIVNRLVIHKQISKRFVLLTEDVNAISGGDYDRKIRVSGPDEIGDIARALGMFKEQASELQRSNAELEKFAYAAAHDLRSPLDAIQDLARWTLEDERPNLSPNCIDNLELLIARSSRLSALQADLLTYAKVGQMDASVRAFDLGNEVAKLADLLDPKSKFNIHLENNPGEITTYSLPARQILLNLVTNAIKHHDKDSGQIAVRYESVQGMHRISVEDDGQGIEPRYQSKIFELFKTLRPRDSVEGSGLGLALVSKLVERLDGRLTVYSNAPEERGSVFTFEIANLHGVRRTSSIAA